MLRAIVDQDVRQSLAFRCQDGQRRVQLQHHCAVLTVGIGMR